MVLGVSSAEQTWQVLAYAMVVRVVCKSAVSLFKEVVAWGFKVVLGVAIAKHSWWIFASAEVLWKF